MGITALFIGFALLLAVAGIACLFSSWRRLAIVKGRSATLIGWLLLLLAIPFWSLALGLEFGLSYALLCSALLAWLTVFMNYELRQGRQRDMTSVTLQLPNGTALGQHLLLFLLAVPLAGLASAFSTTAVLRLLPVQTGNALVATLLLLPIVWGAAACWVCADPKLHRPTLTLLTLLVVSTLLLYV